MIYQALCNEDRRLVETLRKTQPIHALKCWVSFLNLACSPDRLTVRRPSVAGTPRRLGHADA